jgi:hypothetical protein
VLGNLDARRDWGWAPEYVDAMVRALRHDEPDDYVVATGTAHTGGRVRRGGLTRAGLTDWQRYVRVDPQFVRPVDAVELAGDASRRGRARLATAGRLRRAGRPDGGRRPALRSGRGQAAQVHVTGNGRSSTTSAASTTARCTYGSLELEHGHPPGDGSAIQ